MKPLMAMAALSSVMWAQDAGLKARELFYSPPPDATPPPAVNKSLPARRPQTRPTPGGVPVLIISPGIRVMKLLM